MGLRTEALSLVSEAWAGARVHVVKVLRNAFVYGFYLLVMLIFEWLLTLRPPTGLAGKLAVVLVSFGELASVIQFIFMSVLDEWAEIKGKLTCVA